jgi:hypothetical protein
MQRFGGGHPLLTLLDLLLYEPLRPRLRLSKGGFPSASSNAHGDTPDVSFIASTFSAVAMRGAGRPGGAGVSLRS